MQFAKKRAVRLTQIQELVHDARGRGENLAWSWSSDPNFRSEPCRDVVKAWYDEIQIYNFNKPGFSSLTGHFTQVVWKDTTRVGCAQLASNGSKGGVYTVCNYMNPGNVQGLYKKNVKKPKQSAFVF